MKTQLNGPAINGRGKVLETAIRLHAAGFWPILVFRRGAAMPGRDDLAEGKEPIGAAWGAERWSEDKLRATAQRNPGAGCGLCLGPGRGPEGEWLADFEGDGPEAEESRAALFGGELVDSMGWGSTRGAHRLFTIDGERLLPILGKLKGCERRDQPGVYKFPILPGLELRIGGYKADRQVKQIQSVIPPTPGTDGRPRVWNGVEQIADAPDAFYRGLERIADYAPEMNVKAADAKPRRANDAPPPAGTLSRYGIAALADECGKVAAQGEGSRNIQLNLSAFKVGRLVGAGAVGESQALEALSAAAQESGLGESEAVRTVRGALAAGKAHPCDLSHVGQARDRPAPKNGHAPANGKAAPPPNGVGAVGANGTTGGRPEIEITTLRHIVVEQALESLRADPSLYCRNQRIITVVTEARKLVKVTKKTVVKQVVNTPRILGLSNAMVSVALTRNAGWYRWVVDKKTGEAAARVSHPPDWAINAVETHKYYPGLRYLRSVAESPFLRPDGTVAESPGYDDDTETLLMPGGAFPPVPARPTRGDAKKATARLLEPLKQFPFASEDDRIVWLAGLLSLIGRPAIIGPCPGIAIDANIRGCGKGLLAELIGIVAAGREPPTMGYPEDPAEMGKMIISIALAGYSMVLLDNVPNGSKFGDPQLDRALTSTVVDGRELGRSKMVGSFDLTAVWVVTGNNISPAHDAIRRWLPCRLESPLERPEKRDDIEIPDLKEHVRANRGALVVDALTILKAHAAEGWPTAGWPVLGSYPDWDRIVRGAIWYATGLDCCATQDRLADQDPEKVERSVLTEGWLKLPGGNTGLTCAEALRFLEDLRKDEKKAGELAKHQELIDALLEWGTKGALPTVRSLGNRLKALKGRNIGGKKFVHAGEDDRSIRWKVVRTGNESAESAESGFSPPARDLASRYDVNVCNAYGKTPGGSQEETQQTQQTQPHPGGEGAREVTRL